MLFIFSIKWGVGAMNLVSQPHYRWGKLVIFDQQQITDMIRHMGILTCKKGDLACPNMEDLAVFGRGLAREQRGRGWLGLRKLGFDLCSTNCTCSGSHQDCLVVSCIFDLSSYIIMWFQSKWAPKWLNISLQTLLDLFLGSSLYQGCFFSAGHHQPWCI